MSPTPRSSPFGLRQLSALPRRSFASLLLLGFASQNSSRTTTTCIGFIGHPPSENALHRRQGQPERPRYGPLRLASFEPCEDKAITG